MRFAPFCSFFRKRYELTNHLGNVLAVISDKKICNSPGGYDTALYYTADVIMAQDYYPFGSEEPGRIWTQTNKSSYRFNFNGKEHDDETYGPGNEYNYGARIYDPRIGRFFTVDPKSNKFSWSPYSYSGNSPIAIIDDGEGPQDRVRAARQFLNKGYVYSNKTDNTGRPLRTTYTQAALQKQDCVELVTRVLIADGAIHSMNVNKNDYYLARKISIGVLLNDAKKFAKSQTPQVGDIAFWEGHVGIVTGVDPKTHKFKLLHAANEDAGIYENKTFTTTAKYSHGTFYGFYHPLNETKENKQIDITKQPVANQPNVDADQNAYVEPKKPVVKKPKNN